MSHILYTQQEKKLYTSSSNLLTTRLLRGHGGKVVKSVNLEIYYKYTKYIISATDTFFR